MQAPISNPEALSSLLRQCAQLCAQSDEAIQKIGSKRNAFLLENLSDAVQQLDLILSVIESESTGKPVQDDRRSMLKRFFNRGAEVTEEEHFDAPTFDVSRQGLQGNSWSVPIPELLSFLSFGRKTGVLWVDTPTENFLLGITDGVLMHGSSDHTPEGLRIGEILVGFGYLTRRQLDRHITGTRDGNGPTTGESLMSSGMITAEELHRALVHQVQQMILRMVGSKHAIFRFREGFQVTHAHQVRLNINQLLLSSAQAQDETSSPEIRSAAVKQDWDSWTQNLSDQISTVSQWDDHDEGSPQADLLPDERVAGESPSKPVEDLETSTPEDLELDAAEVTKEETVEASEANAQRDTKTEDSKAPTVKPAPKEKGKDASSAESKLGPQPNKTKPKNPPAGNPKVNKTHGGRLRSKKRRRKAG